MNKVPRGGRVAPACRLPFAESWACCPSKRGCPPRRATALPRAGLPSRLCSAQHVRPACVQARATVEASTGGGLSVKRGEQRFSSRREPVAGVQALRQAELLELPHVALEGKLLATDRRGQLLRPDLGA